MLDVLQKILNITLFALLPSAVYYLRHYIFIGS